MLSFVDRFRRKQLPVVPIFEPLYKRIETLDLHAAHGLHGVDELKRMLAMISSDDDFKTLAWMSERRIVQRVDPLFYNLNVDRKGAFYGYILAIDPVGDFSREERDLSNAFSRFFPQTLSVPSVRNGLLDYVRFAPYQDAFSSHIG